jgi:D-proline reductase (dithiol) PrdB
MATYEDLSLPIRLFMKGYPFSRYKIDPVPCARLPKPLNASRFALITTAGLHTPGQSGFDHSIKMGDASFREIPNSIETGTLIESHRSSSFDHTGIQIDINLAFPLDRFRELESQKVIGVLNHRHFSFMGSIIGPRRLIDETAPRIARMLREDGVDAVLLTPVWPMCVQTVGLVQAAIERLQIATVSISLLREVTEVIRPPRALFVPFPMGYPLGAENNPELQHRVIRSALALLERDDVPVVEEFK